MGCAVWLRGMRRKAWGVAELADIGSTPFTAGTITVGGTTTNSLEVFGDHDWFSINLSAGQAITVTLNGVTLVDPYLRILDSAGNQLYYDDDIHSGVVLDSQISFAAGTSGVYYIDVGAFDDAGAGTYQLAVTAFQAPTAVWTNDQIAQQLVSGYWADGQHPFNISSGGSLTVNITGLNAAGQALARQALQTWEEITGINFVETTSATPQIMFTDDDPDGGAFTEGLTYNGQFVTSALINIDASWLQDFGSTVGTYTYQAYLHEIGHALGLGHAGNYNEVATYPYDALYVNDAWATSVMSYFSQTESNYFNSRGFDDAFLITPMVADILAVQQLYGLSTTTRSGATTYGFNSNAGNIYNAQQYSLATVAYTIFDTGGTDTLDYSGYAVAQRIDLNSEQFSSIGGQNGNVTIARGTIIENAIGGSSADVIIGNSATNVLTGRAGVDRLTGGSGNDTFQDTRAGLNGDTITDFAAGDRIVFTDATLATFTFNLSGSILTYTGGSLILSAPVVGTITASAAAGGGVQLAIASPAVPHFGDFNGDNRDDILLRHDTGTITNWLGEANGGLFSNHVAVAYGLNLSWQVAGIGDFNGDGRDDVLLKHDNGAVTDWLGAPNGTFFSNHANASYALPAGWHIVSTGDFNGDARDDVLLRHDAGTITNWLGQDNGGFFSNHAVSAYGLDNSWTVAGIGDFNGDLRDDLLLVHANGAVTNWLGQANGTYFSNHAAASYSLPAGWHIVGVGDFNGDTRDDLLLRHDNGTITNWLGQANGSFFSNHGIANYPLDNAWQVAGVGDFNGDGHDDLLIRHANGTVTDWLGQANGSFFSNHLAANYSLDTSWHVRPDDLWV